MIGSGGTSGGGGVVDGAGIGDLGRVAGCLDFWVERFRRLRVLISLRWDCILGNITEFAFEGVFVLPIGSGTGRVGTDGLADDNRSLGVIRRNENWWTIKWNKMFCSFYSVECWMDLSLSMIIYSSIAKL